MQRSCLSFPLLFPVKDIQIFHLHKLILLKVKKFTYLFLASVLFKFEYVVMKKALSSKLCEF